MHSIKVIRSTTTKKSRKFSLSSIEIASYKLHPHQINSFLLQRHCKIAITRCLITEKPKTNPLLSLAVKQTTQDKNCMQWANFNNIDVRRQLTEKKTYN